MSDKIFLSADIEGTCGIAHWDETEKGHIGYDYFAKQMSKEVSACVSGILSKPEANIFVRDSHDSARNILPDMLPQDERVHIFRGWGRDPYGMMSGIDETFTGVMFTGYHSAVGWSGNPLSHTMNTKNITVQINHETASELMMNSLTASMFGVPVLLVSGDEMLCNWMQTKVPTIQTIPVSKGRGNGSISMMPEVACKKIKEASIRALEGDLKGCMYPMPDHFDVSITYRDHFTARGASWYPGATLLQDRTVSFKSHNWMDVLTFFHFCL